MIEDVLSERIAAYAPRDALEQESVITELLQQYVLVGLARAGLFRVAEFHGGTFLRIVHKLDRYSEDLDFVLKDPDPEFVWRPYLEQTTRFLEAEGARLDIVDKSGADAAVAKAFLNTEAVGTVLVLDLPHSRDTRRKIKIKLEADRRPPAGSVFETRYLHFPVLTAITTQTLESALASKLHALLCRPYVKGRDWYDLLWYVARDVRPNLELLTNALDQAGPWAGERVAVTPSWCLARLREVIGGIDWPGAADDVRRFLGPRAQESLDLWSEGLFDQQVERLGRAMGSDHRV